MTSATLPSFLILDPLLQGWLMEDIGRGDRTTEGLFLLGEEPRGQGRWFARQEGVVAGLTVAARIFRLLDHGVEFVPLLPEGARCDANQPIARFQGPLTVLLTGERVALNLVMRLSGVATATRAYVEAIADWPAQLVDTRKTTPGLRLLEKYASRVGGAVNHRLGLDDAVMIKDNHIAAAGGIQEAIARVRTNMPYPLAIEVETETLEQVQSALSSGANIIMLDNMPWDVMKQAVQLIRQTNPNVLIESSGNVTLETIQDVADTGVDYISSSAPITRSAWLDISMCLDG